MSLPVVLVWIGAVAVVACSGPRVLLQQERRVNDYVLPPLLLPRC